jgi:hypothetical protein
MGTEFLGHLFVKAKFVQTILFFRFCENEILNVMMMTTGDNEQRKPTPEREFGNVVTKARMNSSAARTRINVGE